MTRTTIALLALTALHLYWRGNVYRDALRVLSRRHAETRQRMVAPPQQPQDARQMEWVVGL